MEINKYYENIKTSETLKLINFRHPKCAFRNSRGDILGADILEEPDCYKEIINKNTVLAYEKAYAPIKEEVLKRYKSILETVEHWSVKHE
ncbi:hypothetical protein [Viridibacillus arvi]|uniref:hypothetical protein n=1 Tax=Viridibacillus arvi TaxID=263475 RepID=UPI0034CEAAD8